MIISMSIIAKTNYLHKKNPGAIQNILERSCTAARGRVIWCSHQESNLVLVLTKDVYCRYTMGAERPSIAPGPVLQQAFCGQKVHVGNVNLSANVDFQQLVL